MVLAQPFSTSAPALASFSFSDITTGTGYITFFASGDEDGNLVLLPFKTRAEISPFAQDLKTASTVFNTSGTPEEINFDALFNRTVIIEGDMILEIPAFNGNDQGSTQNTGIDLDVRVLHVDSAAAETVLGSVDTEFSDDSTTSNNFNEHIYIYKVNIARTAFRKGEKLRLEINHHGNTASGGEASVVTFSPNGEAIAIAAGGATLTTTIDTSLLVHVPFKLE